MRFCPSTRTTITVILSFLTVTSSFINRRYICRRHQYSFSSIVSTAFIKNCRHNEQQQQQQQQQHNSHYHHLQTALFARRRRQQQQTHPTTILKNKNNVTMPPNSSSNNKTKKKRSRKKATTPQQQRQQQPSIVGPHYMRVVTGTLLSQPLSIVFCGESHEDAIDVTRKGGVFAPQHGWVPVATVDDVLKNGYDEEEYNNEEEARGLLTYRVLKKREKMARDKAMEWAKEYVEENVEEEECWIFLVWVPSGGGRGTKGRAVIFHLEEEEDEAEDDEDAVGKVTNGNGNNDATMSYLDDIVEELNDARLTTKRKTNAPQSPPPPTRHLYEWRDLDTEAHHLNRHRLTTHHDICETTHDALIAKRKLDRRSDSQLWTWDDWFSHVRQQSQEDNSRTNVHLIMEAGIPPHEFELHREEEATIPTAARCVRQLPDDDEEDEENERDPSMDGCGSYLNFMYRKFVREQKPRRPNDVDSWLHFVDCRDMGCEQLIASEEAKEDWKECLLLPEERGRVEEDGIKTFSWNKNPEDEMLVQLQKEGRLVPREDDDDDEEEEEEEYLTFPSFEGFFGQNTDVLYFTPHVKVAYAPFLIKCLPSYSLCDEFFSKLFFGGSIPEALALLRPEGIEGGYCHVRSPIQERCDDDGRIVYHKRNNDEYHTSFPFLPLKGYLKARGSSPPRTWSSALYSRFTTPSDEDELTLSSQKKLLRGIDFATRARQWSLSEIRKHIFHPKGGSVADGNDGEYFLAYLRAVHREIYDDIDVSNPEALLEKMNMPSLTNGKKYKVGGIEVPRCDEALKEMVERFDEEAGENGGGVVEESKEVMAKILIDIWMSLVVDFSTIMTMGHIVAKASSSSKDDDDNGNDKNNVVIVCYMGSVHTRAIERFFVEQLGFVRKCFVGKMGWEDEEARVLRLPSCLWNLDELF